jgi:hypothetical protein
MELDGKKKEKKKRKEISWGHFRGDILMGGGTIGSAYGTISASAPTIIYEGTLAL